MFGHAQLQQLRRVRHDTVRLLAAAADAGAAGGRRRFAGASGVASTAPCRVGAAERAGLSVRALHHYEAAGLMTPARTGLGHRRYSEEHIQRLKRIAQLRRLGLSLEAIGACLAGEPLTRRRVLELRLESIREQRALLQQAADQLEDVLVAEATSAGALDLWAAVDVMAALEQRLEPAPFAAWTRARREQGPALLAERERRFRELVEQLRAEQLRGTSPREPPVLALARCWDALAREVYGDDDALRCDVAAAVSQVPGLVEGHGCDRAVLQYVGRALVVLNSLDAGPDACLDGSRH